QGGHIRRGPGFPASNRARTSSMGAFLVQGLRSDTIPGIRITPEWLSSVRRKTIKQPVAACASEIGLGAAALGTAGWMRGIPGFRRVVVPQTHSIGMADDRRALGAARPILAGSISFAGKCGAIGLRSRQHIVTVWRVAAAVDHLALFGKRSLLRKVVVWAMQIGRVLCDRHTLGILPRTLANAITRIDRGLTVSSLRREIGAPGFCADACRLRQRLAMLVGAGEPAKIGAVADADAGDKEGGAG